MQKEVLKIEKDEELDYCTVLVRVPEFQNFGARMEELEEKANDAILNDPNLPNLLGDLTEKLSGITQNSMKTLEDRAKSLPGGPEKEQARQAFEMMQKMQKEFLSDDDSDEDDEEEEDPDEEEEESEESKLEKDPQVLTVNLPTGADWDKTYETRLDEFLKEWPTLRAKVQKKAFALYKKLHADVLEFYGEECRESTLPDPTSEDVIPDLFKISSVHLHKDGRVGISGNCTWDEEHGFGAMIKNGKILELGAASDAF